MPGSGKSTIGRSLAKRFNKKFIDADDLIEAAANLPIQSIVDGWGLKRFSELEESVLCDLDLQNSIISTGGSAVYCHTAMRKLGENGIRIYLRITAKTLLQRVKNESSRGLYKYPAHGLMRVYRDRQDLYPKYADLTFDNDGPFTALTAQRLFDLFVG